MSNQKSVIRKNKKYLLIINGGSRRLQKIVSLVRSPRRLQPSGAHDR